MAILLEYGLGRAESLPRSGQLREPEKGLVPAAGRTAPAPGRAPGGPPEAGAALRVLWWVAVGGPDRPQKARYRRRPKAPSYCPGLQKRPWIWGPKIVNL